MNKKDEKNPLPPRKSKRLLILLSLLILVGGAETAGRIVYDRTYKPQEQKLLRAFMGLETDYDPNMVSNYIPHHYMVYILNPATLYFKFYGTQPVHMVNSKGFRGEEFLTEKPKGVYRIFCLGGSTTFSLTEPDETKTYPRLLQDELNRRFKPQKFEVINAGTPGWSSAESLINLHFRVLEYDPDMVIVYHAVNDTFAMRRPEEGRSDYSTFRQIMDFRPPSETIKKALRYSALCRLLFVRGRNVAFDVNSLAVKPLPAFFDENKQLDNATGKYFRRNMKTLVGVAKTHGITPVLVTVGHGPWHPSLSRANQIAREVARETGALLVDFEPHSQPGYFSSDNVHFTRAGNQARVEVIADTFEKERVTFASR